MSQNLTERFDTSVTYVGFFVCICGPWGNSRHVMSTSIKLDINEVAFVF